MAKSMRCLWSLHAPTTEMWQRQPCFFQPDNIYRPICTVLKFPLNPCMSAKPFWMPNTYYHARHCHYRPYRTWSSLYHLKFSTVGLKPNDCRGHSCLSFEFATWKMLLYCACSGRPAYIKFSSSAGKNLVFLEKVFRFLGFLDLSIQISRDIKLPPRMNIIYTIHSLSEHFL